MGLGRFGTVLFASVLAAVAVEAVSAQDDPSNDGMTERTFTAPISEKEAFKADISELKKSQFSGTQMAPVEMEDLGISLVTGEFTNAEAELLLSKGYQEPAPFEVSLFHGGSCDSADRLEPMATADVVPPNVCRVIGSPQEVVTPVVWIIDSGVDPTVVSTGLLNIAERIDCTTSPCSTTSSLTDTQGHGTMVAGIVGGRRVPVTNGHLGLVGVSPGATLKVIKAFRGKSTNIFGPPRLALRYIRDEAIAGRIVPGEILNLSWGAEFLEAPRSGGQFEKLAEIDNLVHQIADKGVRIVIAAGNARDEENGSWVQSFFPANASEYISPVTTGGSIQSVSASDSQYVGANQLQGCGTLTNAWCDRLWRGGSYGASMAEPGVDVPILWKSTKNGALRRNVCSGTSLAAPVLAGLLARSPFFPKAPVLDGLIQDADEVGFITPGKADVTSDEPKCTN
ncbi:S8 family peptidase [Mesorhizobium sp. f-mel]